MQSETHDGLGARDALDFVTSVGTDFNFKDSDRIEAESVLVAPGGSSKYTLRSADDSDATGDESETEGTENREEQIVAPPLKSGPEARDTSVDILRLRRAAQIDSVLPRSRSWSSKYVDEDDARRELESELKKDTAKFMSTLHPHPPDKPAPSNVASSPRRKVGSSVFSQIANGIHSSQHGQSVEIIEAEDAQGHSEVSHVSAFDQSLTPRAAQTVHGVAEMQSVAVRNAIEHSKHSNHHENVSSWREIMRSPAPGKSDHCGARQDPENAEDDNDLDINPLQFLPKKHPVHKIIKRLLNKTKLSALHAWLSWHSGHMQKKQRILDQYVTCCAWLKPKRSPFLRNQLRCWLFKPSAGKLELASSGMTSRDVQAILCALAGAGPGLKSERAVNIIEICDEFGDFSLEALDLSRNEIGAEGARILVEIIISNNFFCLRHLKRTPSVSTATRATGCITYVDLSRNKLGPSSAQHLKNLLSNLSCTIKTILLSGNVLGDAGCATVVSGLVDQESVEYLDLSENAAASACGFALGNMLPSNQTLKHLYLNFNSLRGPGARAACMGLAKNGTLETLMLQWNGMGDDDTMNALARALTTCNLKVLSLADNRIKLKGASILAASLELGTGLSELELDGNKIGQIGSRAILAAVQAAAGEEGFQTSVSTNNCGANLVDKSAFDPGETAGKYELDLRESYDRTVLVKLIRTMIQGKGAFTGIRVGDKVLNHSLILADALHGNIDHADSIEMADWRIVTNRGHSLPIAEFEDETGQLAPLEGVWAKVLNRKLEQVSLSVKFSYASLRKRANASDALPVKSFLTLHDGLSSPLSNATHCLDLIDTVMGPDVFITIDQAKQLFECINSPQDLRYRELLPVRSHMLSKFYHKIVESGRNKEMLEWCSQDVRKTLEKQLGAVSFTFTPNNPTGFHKLDLSDMSQREIATRLTEIRNDTEPRMQQLRAFYSGGKRAGGRRETADDNIDLERAWRNSRFNGHALRWSNDWALPHHGILEVDFVEVTKPDPNDHKDGDLSAMDERKFGDFVSSLRALEDDSQRVITIRQYSNTGFFYVRQLARLLPLVQASNLKVEICVIGYARTLDWHGYKNLLMNLSIPQVRLLEHRVGYINLFDDLMAVDYYELDLSRSSHRWVMQELLHLAAVEPGNNVIECTLEGIDFDIPAGWLKDVPRRGSISFYYCREQRVIEQCFKRGSWDSEVTPWFMREDGTEFGESSWSVFAPTWLNEFCVAKPVAGPAPHDSDWVRAHKIRRIKGKMLERYSDPKKMFNAMDRDGGGSLDRKELAMGLFALEIWLHPKELQCLLDILDEDGGGDIDFDEFKNFWDTYNFEVVV